MDTSLIQSDSRLPASTVEVTSGEDHQVSFHIVYNVAWDRLELTNDLQRSAKKADVIIYGTLASCNYRIDSVKLLTVKFYPLI